jgi:hypothetical protein
MKLEGVGAEFLRDHFAHFALIPSNFMVISTTHEHGKISTIFFFPRRTRDPRFPR